jgi:hypothetical protein
VKKTLLAITSGVGVATLLFAYVFSKRFQTWAATLGLAGCEAGLSSPDW